MADVHDCHTSNGIAPGFISESDLDTLRAEAHAALSHTASSHTSAQCRALYETVLFLVATPRALQRDYASAVTIGHQAAVPVLTAALDNLISTSTTPHYDVTILRAAEMYNLSLVNLEASRVLTDHPDFPHSVRLPPPPPRFPGVSESAGTSTMRRRSLPAAFVSYVLGKS